MISARTGETTEQLVYIECVKCGKVMGNDHGPTSALLRTALAPEDPTGDAGQRTQAVRAVVLRTWAR